MRRYQAPRNRGGGPAPLERTSPGPPRAFAEWEGLRRWGKLPDSERDVAGYLLRVARERAGLTQRELAQRLGVSQPAITQAERWTSNPTVGFLRLWAEACGCSLGLGFIPPASSAQAAESPSRYDAPPRGATRRRKNSPPKKS